MSVEEGLNASSARVLMVASSAGGKVLDINREELVIKEALAGDAGSLYVMTHATRHQLVVTTP